MFSSFVEIFNLGSNVVGAKAYNVSKCWTAIRGEDDIQIPKSLVLTKHEAISFYNSSTERKKILTAIKEYFRDNRIIIRSSSVYEDSKFFSAAGQYQTCMDLYEGSDIQNAILTVYDSTNALSAKVYNGLYLDGNEALGENMAILIQEMIPCEYSGVLYTSNPLSKSKQMLIEFTTGLGDKVASGEKNFKTYPLDSLVTITNEKIEVMDENFKRQLKKLEDVAYKLIEEFGSELDIEWGFYRGNIYIFQARPMFFCSSKISGIYNLDLVSHTYAIKGRTVSTGIAIGEINDDNIAVLDNMRCVGVSQIIKHSALLVKEGGVLSHAASLTRELGKPCVLLEYGEMSKNQIYILDGYNGEIIPWCKLSYYEKSMYLWEAFFHIAENVNKNLLRLLGITNVKIEHKFEAVVVDSELLYRQTDNYDCYDQYLTTYDIDGDELINYNIIVRKQKNEEYTRLQVKYINLSKVSYREDQELLFYFESDADLEKFIQKFPLHITGNQHRKVLRFIFNNYTVNLIKWSNNKSYMTVESTEEKFLFDFCGEIKKTPEILFCKSGKELFEELEIELDFNN